MRISRNTPTSSNTRVVVLTADAHFEQQMRQTFSTSPQIDLNLVPATVAGAGGELDPDGATVIVIDLDAGRADEMQALDGFDMDWGTDFLGDAYVVQGAAAVALAPGPQDWKTGWADGRLWSTHTRTLEAPLTPGPEGVTIQIYDPGYYVAYAITGEPEVTGRGDCTATIFVPDLDAAQTQLLDSLKEYVPGDDLEDVVFPNVGADFAEEVRVTCGP